MKFEVVRCKDKTWDIVLTTENAVLIIGNYKSMIEAVARANEMLKQASIIEIII